MNLIRTSGIFQYTEQLEEAIRSKNQSIIGSGLWSSFMFTQSGRNGPERIRCSEGFQHRIPNGSLLKTSRQSKDGSSLIMFWTWRKEPRMNMSLSVYRAAIFRRLPKEMVSSFLQNRLPGKWLPIALGRQHC